MKDKKLYLEVKDHSVSGEIFQLVYNKEYDILETFPQLSQDKLSEYYKSENYISHTDSRRNVFERVYHLVRRYSLKQKLKLIEKHSHSGKTLLDVGCGTGDFLKTALNAGWEVQGVEPNERARAIANRKTNNKVDTPGALDNFQDASFDVITLWHVLEHLPNLEQQIKMLSRLLKRDGILIIAVPNFKSYDAKHYKTFWAAYDVPRHLWHFSKDSVKKLFSDIGMTLYQIKPMLFDSFYVSLLSEKYKSGKIKPLKGFYRGLVSNLKAIRSGEWSSLIYLLKKS